MVLMSMGNTKLGLRPYPAVSCDVRTMDWHAIGTTAMFPVRNRMVPLGRLGIEAELNNVYTCSNIRVAL